MNAEHEKEKTDTPKTNSEEEHNWEPKQDQPQTASRQGSAVIIPDILLFA
jgi:hypothetical protein